jgi:large subunit ribosomal protein L35
MAKKQSPKQKKSKLKTHKAAASRIHVTGTGKLLRMKGHQSHLRRRKSAAAKRMFGHKLPIPSSDASRLRRLIPYA